ncbi:hypothetical protein ASG52_23840 [Methylobacterium sp. Leaf456]|uniref:hypothetical protein n=1 Tax=Methylobacterium sp. Leaf456 TaxID=1736382 RepID=UPI0006F8FCE2|nr:hypothetical protein [Methylobacterium sp. Leaf456]KQT56223.1 hypothetical protein ASG52_23840 [Methylobacterium sp. Leaf456]
MIAGASHRGTGRAWAGFARLFVGTAAGLFLGYLALAALVDPYDSGRSPLLSAGAVRQQGPRTAAAWRGRDPAFAGAVLGNSHIQLVEPARLTAATGIPFVQLSVPATGPGEQIALLGWFLRHHPRPDALVLSIDDLWCSDDPALPNEKPFPFWLYSPDALPYLRGLLRWPVAQEVVGRLGWLAGPRRRTARPDGFWDYGPDYAHLDPDRLHASRETPVPEAADPGRAGPDFPAADRLGALLAGVPPQTPVVMVFPPVYASALPRAGSPRARAEAACRAAMRAALARHPRSDVVDGRRDRAALHDPVLFFDRTHYRHDLARALADEIAASLNGLRSRTSYAPGP